MDPLRFPGSVVAKIDENDVDNLIVFSNRIASAQRRHDRVALSMLHRLAEGAEVEAGPHVVERQVIEEDRYREERLLIDGVVRFRLVQGATSVVSPRAVPMADGAV